MNVPDKIAYPQLTSTRFIAAFLVVVYHFGILPREVVPFIYFDKINFFNQAGSCAVYYFFVLSGFVLTSAYRNRNIKYTLFIINRLGRIYPAYFLALLLIILIIIIPTYEASNFLNDPTTQTAKKLIKVTLVNTQLLDKFSLLLNLCLSQSWNLSTWQTFNGPGWSLSVEFFLYLLFPILLPSLRHKDRKYLVVLLFITCFLSISCTILVQPAVAATSQGFIFFGSPLLAIPSFLIGMLTYEISLRVSVDQQSISPLLLLCFSSSICTLLICFYPNVDFVLPPFFAIIIWALAQDKSILSRTLSHPKLVLLGEISYGYYILQIPLFLIAQRWLHLFDDSSDTAFFYLLNLMLLAVAWVSFHWIETPIRKRVNAYTSRFSKISSTPPKHEQATF